MPSKSVVVFAFLPLTAAALNQPHSFGGAWLTNAQDQGIYFRHASTIEGHAKEEGEFVIAGWAMLGLPGLSGMASDR